MMGDLDRQNEIPVRFILHPEGLERPAVGVELMLDRPHRFGISHDNTTEGFATAIAALCEWLAERLKANVLT